ncbi:hypothetical protein [Methylobacterium gregans]|uniref:Uncharacterized protein n=1 Tax=Methylobacterium gregans TaxID=374424 RepID=A0AA37HLN6_9HYPH|nr:hypothetical protein [Methylobacterium gregans]MDQ0519129.1 hypothetical protein [Methylobacterium gregans]GJD77696.1 hypothetical protein NBEOAGPD_0903 [Methylobacterium gregans]GLS53696.1 hypothetical protein GCM10007886_18790 [Methylobacterium gregans]
MNLDAQHDRTALPPAPIPTTTDPIQQTTDSAEQGRIDETANRSEGEPAATPTNTFEAFGSFPG